MTSLLNRLHSIFATSTDTDNIQHAAYDDARISVATLLLEAAIQDGKIDDTECAAIQDILTRKFSLAADDAEKLYALAEKKLENSHQILSYTRTIKDTMDADERIGLMEMLWEVACADGKIDQYESNLLRRIAGLIYVSDRESGEARIRVMKQLEINQNQS